MYFLRLMFKLSPGLVIGDILSGTLRLLPQRLISVIGIKYIIDVVVQGENLGRIYKAVIIIALIIVLSRIAVLLYREFYWNAAKERLYFRLNKTLYEKAHLLDLESYDNRVVLGQYSGTFGNCAELCRQHNLFGGCCGGNSDNRPRVPCNYFGGDFAFPAA